MKYLTYSGMIQNYDKISRWNVEFSKVYTLWKININSKIINKKHVIYWDHYMYF
jgi:hypothetical protein